jgi:hypothetical protein
MEWRKQNEHGQHEEGDPEHEQFHFFLIRMAPCELVEKALRLAPNSALFSMRFRMPRA